MKKPSMKPFIVISHVSGFRNGSKPVEKLDSDTLKSISESLAKIGVNHVYLPPGIKLEVKTELKHLEEEDWEDDDDE